MVKLTVLWACSSKYFAVSGENLELNLEKDTIDVENLWIKFFKERKYFCLKH